MLSKKHCQYNGFCYQGEKNENTVIFNLRVAKNINILQCCCPQGLQHLAKDSQTDAFWGLAPVTAIISNTKNNKDLSLDFSIDVFFEDAGAVTHFKQRRFLQTDDVTHGSLCTEQFLCAHALTQRGL